MSRHLLCSLLYGLTITFMAQSFLFATPQNNIFDPAPAHSPAGTDKFYNPIKEKTWSLSFSPFYAHTGTASVPGSGKTWGSNIHGKWNMGAIFFNPISTASSLPSYNAAKINLAALSPITGGSTQYNTNYTDQNAYSPDNASTQAATFNFVPVNIEKIGLRGKCNFELPRGFGITIKGGAAETRQIIMGNFDTGSLINDTYSNSNAQALYTNLMSAPALQKISRDVGINVSSFKKTGLEDVHVSLSWQIPFPMKETGDSEYADKEEVVLSLVPYLSVGTWIPLADHTDQSNPFSLPAGNNGHIGLTAEAALALDFPEMMQISIGGGAVFFAEKDFAQFRMPTHSAQIGFIPWTTSVTRRPGITWYLNASMKAENFVSKKDIPNFSFYFDYIYTEHIKDSIILREPDNTKAALFLPSVVESRSAYRTQQMFGALHCAFTSNIGASIGAQGTISGARSYRPTTLIWSLNMKF